MKYFLAFICLLFLNAYAGLIDEGGWVLESDKDGIKLFSKNIKNSAIVPLKGEMVVAHSLEEVIAVFDDKGRRNEWIERFEESRTLEKTTLYDQIEYARVSLPLWFDDRTCITKIRILVNDDLNTIYFLGSSIKNYPMSKDLKRGVEAKVYDSSIKLEKIGGKVKITIITFTDPNGSIPGWVVNFFTEKVARNSLRNLRTQLSKNYYSPKHLKKYTYRIKNFKLLNQVNLQNKVRQNKVGGRH